MRLNQSVITLVMNLLIAGVRAVVGRKTAVPVYPPVNRDLLPFDFKVDWYQSSDGSLLPNRRSRDSSSVLRVDDVPHSYGGTQ